MGLWCVCELLFICCCIKTSYFRGSVCIYQWIFIHSHPRRNHLSLVPRERSHSKACHGHAPRCQGCLTSAKLPWKFTILSKIPWQCWAKKRFRKLCHDYWETSMFHGLWIDCHDFSAAWQTYCASLRSPCN